MPTCCEECPLLFSPRRLRGQKEGESVVTIPFKVSDEEERDQIKRDAHQHNMNVSEYIRWLIEEERENNATMA